MCVCVCVCGGVQGQAVEIIGQSMRTDFGGFAMRTRPFVCVCVSFLSVSVSLSVCVCVSVCVCLSLSIGFCVCARLGSWPHHLPSHPTRPFLRQRRCARAKCHRYDRLPHGQGAHDVHDAHIASPPHHPSSFADQTKQTHAAIKITNTSHLHSHLHSH